MSRLSVLVTYLLTLVESPASVDVLWLTWQGSHRLKKYLNLEGFLEKSLKI